MKFYIETVGCQMNVLDSELAAAALISAGWERLATRKDADLILFNTCSVREHAEEKIYSALGRLKHWKVIRIARCVWEKPSQYMKTVRLAQVCSQNSSFKRE